MADEAAPRDAGVQVIARAAAILRALRPEGTSLGGLARATGLPRSTVQRIVEALAAEQLVESGADGVRPGWGLQRLARLAQADVAARVRPHLEALWDATHETVELSAGHGREVAVLDRILCDQEVRVVPPEGRPCPLHAAVAGLAILSCLDDARVAGLVGGQAPPDALAAVRRCGFAYDREAHVPGVCAVGVPIDVPGLRPHAVSVAVPAQRFEASLPRLRLALAECRARMEAELRCGEP